MSLMGTPTNSAVRPARASDARAIAAVQALSWAHDLARVLPDEVRPQPNSPEQISAWRESIGAPDDGPGRVIVALDDDRVVGVLAWSSASDPDLTDRDVEIVELSVDPEQRRAGHGSRLLSAWADLARGEGARTGVAWVPAGAELIGFLGSAGFAVDGASRTLDLYGDGALEAVTERMTTNLAPDPVAVTIEAAAPRG